MMCLKSWKSNFNSVWNGVKKHNEVPEHKKLWFSIQMNHFVHCRAGMSRGKYRRSQIESLMSSCPHAFTKDNDLDKWLKMYKLVRSHIFLYGIPKLNDTLGTDVFNLAGWFYNQYELYKMKMGTMTPKDPRRVLWEKLVEEYKDDFKYIVDYSKMNTAKSMKWHSMFLQLQASISGNTPIECRSEEYYWVMCQQREFRLKVGGMKEGSLRRKLWRESDMKRIVDNVVFDFDVE